MEELQADTACTRVLLRSALYDQLTSAHICAHRSWDQRGFYLCGDLLAGGAREGIYRGKRRSNLSGRQGLQQVCLTMLM